MYLESFQTFIANDHVKILDGFEKGICLIQELRKALQQLQGELQNKSQQLRTLEMEKYSEIRSQEQNIQHLNHSLSHKDQLLQVSVHDFNLNWGSLSSEIPFYNLKILIHLH